MIRSMIYWVCAIAVTAMGMVACETEEGNIDIPTEQTIECKAGERASLKFEVADKWRIWSDATWCEFMTPAGKVLDMSGERGSHTVTLAIGSQDLKNETSTAHITMKCGNKESIIATVIRAAKELTIKLYDKDNNEIDAINLGYNIHNTFYVEANFRFAAVEFPEWVEFEGGSVAGLPNERIEAKVRIQNNGERERTPITVEDGHKVTFAEVGGDATFDFPIIFEGMGAYSLTFIGPTEKSFDWEVSLDGKQFRQVNDDESVTTFEEYLQYNITAQDNKYEIVTIERAIDRGIPSHRINAEWIAFDKESMRLSVEESLYASTRYGMVLALPMAVYAEIRDDIKGKLIEYDDASGIQLETLRYDYLKYLLIEFKQCDFTERDPYVGMYIYHSITTLEIEPDGYYYADSPSEPNLYNEYGVEEVWIAPMVLPAQGLGEMLRPGIIIDPRIEGWNTESHAEGVATAEVKYKDRVLTIKDNEYYLGENKDEVMSLHFWGPKDSFDEEVYIIFKLNGEAKKLLVVTPPTNAE